MKKFQTYFSKAKLIIPFCLFSLFFVRSFSQELILYEEPLASRIAKSKQVVQESEFIFEGKYVSRSTQSIKNSENSIVTYILKVEHVYKGNLNIGTVQAQWTGPVGGYYKEIIIENGKETVLEMYRDVSHSQGPRFSMSKSSIFFCKAKQLSDYVNDTIYNKQILEFIKAKSSTVNYDYIDAKNVNYELGGLHNLLFTKKTDFHKFLEESDSNIVLPLIGRAKAIQDSILYQPQRERHKKFNDSVNKRMLKRCINCKGELKNNSIKIDYYVSGQ